MFINVQYKVDIANNRLSQAASRYSALDVGAMTYLHLLSQDAAECMDLGVGRSSSWHPGQLLPSPKNPTGTVSPQPAHTEEKHRHVKLFLLAW